MKNYFRDLFEYHDKANELVLGILYPENPVISKYAYDMFRHTLLAHHVWSHRILKLPFDYDFKAELSRSQIDELIAKNKKEMVLILDQFDLNDLIEFTNFAGETYKMKLIDILTHVSHHSSYHRGQIARAIREAGLEPPKTDLMLFRR
jgi:uncharacterized damage-inducible protein DinB